MGPFPHDAPAAAISGAQSDGHRRLRIRRIRPSRAGKARRAVRAPWASRRSRSIGPRTCTLWRQGDVNFVVNAEPDSFAQRFAARARALRLRHGVPRRRCASRPMSARCRSAPSLSRARSARWSSTSRRSRGSAARCSISSTAMAPRARSGTSISSGPASAIRSPRRRGLYYLDHLTHNVYRGRMDHWADWYCEAVQLPRDPLLQHRGQADRPDLAGA